MVDLTKIEQESVAQNRLEDVVRELLALGWDQMEIVDAVEQAVNESGDSRD